jgi:hypothetical protein
MLKNLAFGQTIRHAGGRVQRLPRCSGAFTVVWTGLAAESKVYFAADRKNKKTNTGVLHSVQDDDFKEGIGYTYLDSR